MVPGPAHRHERLIIIGGAGSEAGKRGGKVSAGAACRGRSSLIQVAGSGPPLESGRRRRAGRPGVGARQGCPCRTLTRNRVTRRN